jgi:hypothetical protein
MAATFYAEPVLTFDLDVFVTLPASEGGLVSLSPLYDALRRRGYVEGRGCVIIEGVPVPFLPADDALIEEAVAEARDPTYEDASTRVARAEHLVAIALQTGREKDRDRVGLLREQASLDLDNLQQVLARHSLEATWIGWTR